MSATTDTDADADRLDGVTVADVAPFYDDLIKTGTTSPKIHLTDECSRIHGATARAKDPAVLFDDAPICEWCVNRLLPADVERQLRNGGPAHE